MPPAVVTALWDTAGDVKRLYLSSSMKRVRGTSSFRMNTEGSKSVNALLDKTCMRCTMAMETNENGHRNQASCGEVMTLHAWDLVNNSQKPIGESLQDGKIVAVTVRDEKVVIMAPCSGDSQRGGYGCFNVLEDAKLKALPENTVLLDVTPDLKFAEPQQKSVIC